MKRTLSALIAIVMLLSEISACSKTVETTSGFTPPSGTSTIPESTMTTGPEIKEETPGDLFFKKNPQSEAEYYHSVELPKEASDGDYYASNSSFVAFEDKFWRLLAGRISWEGNNPIGSKVYEFDYEGNLLNSFKIQELSNTQTGYFLQDGDSILLVAKKEETELRNENEQKIYVYSYDVENHKGELLFSLSDQYNSFDFDAYKDGKLYAWSAPEQNTSKLMYQRFDLQGNIECETEAIDFSSDILRGTSNEYGYSYSWIYYDGYYANGFWKNDLFCVMTSADGDATFLVQCFDKDLKIVDSFYADVNSWIGFKRWGAENYISDSTGLYRWNEDLALWDTVMEWDKTDYVSRYDVNESRYCGPTVLNNGHFLFPDYTLAVAVDSLDKDTVTTISTYGLLVDLDGMDGIRFKECDFCYDEVYYDDYGKLQQSQVSSEERAIQAFKEGKIDVMVIGELFTDYLPLIVPTSNYIELVELQNNGYCLDLTPYLQSYEDGTNEWDIPIPIDIVRKYETVNGLFLFPDYYSFVHLDTLYSQEKLPLKPDASYSEWLDYAQNELDDDKKLVFFSGEKFLKRCLQYDLYSFIDYSNNCAEFDCQEFRDLLVLCKDYVDTPSFVSSDTQPFEYALITDPYYSIMCDPYSSKNFNRVGCPSAQGSGYLSIPAVFVLISASCSDPDAAWRVLEESMKNEDNSFCIYKTDGYSQYGWREDENSGWDDVTSAYFPDTEIIDIIMQEYKMYAADEQSLDETVSAINSKVQEVIDKRAK